MQIKNTLVLFATAALLASFVGSANAALVATDLNDGGTDVGFTSGWTGSSNVFITAASDLTYANYGITQTGAPEKVYASNAGPDRQDKRSVASMTGEIWFSALVNVPTDGIYGGLTFNNFNAGQPWNPIDTDLRILLDNTTLVVGINSEVSVVSGSGTFAQGTTHLLLGKMNIAVGSDTLSVWVDPDLTAVSGPGDLPGANINMAVDFADSIENLGVAGRKGTIALANVEVDAIRLSDTGTAFVDVTGVPEPGSLALLGLGGLLIARRRRA